MCVFFLRRMSIHNVGYIVELELTRPQAYDSHCNLVLGEVTETVYTVEDDDDESSEETVRVRPSTLNKRAN